MRNLKLQIISYLERSINTYRKEVKLVYTSVVLCFGSLTVGASARLSIYDVINYYHYHPKISLRGLYSFRFNEIDNAKIAV